MTTKTKKPESIRITESTGNVFALLGMANPKQERLKAQLTLQIYKTSKTRA